MKTFHFDTIGNITQEPQEVQIYLWVDQKVLCDKVSSSSLKFNVLAYGLVSTNWQNTASTSLSRLNIVTLN